MHNKNIEFLINWSNRQAILILEAILPFKVKIICKNSIFFRGIKIIESIKI